MRDLAMKGRSLSAVGVKHGAVMLAIVLAVAIGGCLLDRDADGIGDESLDLCVAAVAAIVTPPLLVVTVEVGWRVPAIASSVSIVTPHLPDPPPKSLLLV